MIIGIGVDIVKLDRIAKLVDDKFLARILSEAEMIRYQDINHNQTKISYLGGRFAAKEAIFKAFSKGDLNAKYIDFSILNDEQGKPYVISKFLDDNKTIHLSISHTDEHAIAYCILEKNE